MFEVQQLICLSAWMSGTSSSKWKTLSHFPGNLFKNQHWTEGFLVSPMILYICTNRRFTVIFILMVWSILLLFFASQAALESSSSSVLAIFLHRNSNEGLAFFFFQWFDFWLFFLFYLCAFVQTQTVCLFQLQPLRDGTDLSLWLTFVPVSPSACKRNKQILKANPHHVFSITFPDGDS